MAKLIKKSLMGRKKSNKPLQYAIGGIVSVIVLVIWITSPGRSSSFSAAAIAAGNPFSSRVSDISVLSAGEDRMKTETERMAEEMGAHDGGNNLLSTLFQSGVEEEASAGEETEALGSASGEDDYGDSGSGFGSVPDVSYSEGTVSSGARAKLSALSSSFGGGGGSSNTSGGGSHNKMFGSGSANVSTKKIDVNAGNVKNAALAEKSKGGKTMQSLHAANRFANSAMQAKNLGQASALNSVAFDGGIKKGTVEMADNGLSQSSAEASLGFGQAVKDLKVNDPKLNSTKVVPKTNKPKDATDEGSELKKMLIQMLFQSVIGPVLQTAVGGAMGK